MEKELFYLWHSSDAASKMPWQLDSGPVYTLEDGREVIPILATTTETHNSRWKDMVLLGRGRYTGYKGTPRKLI
jgi:hypothetical protein